MLPLTELGHGGQGQTKWRGSEIGKQPVLEWRVQGLPLRPEMLPTYREEPKLIMEGWLYAL